MRAIFFDPDALAEPARTHFEKWLAKAGSALADAEKGQDLKSRIWGELKEWLLEHVFYGKCAYCEWLLGRSFGAAEHYRPKGAVTVRAPEGKLERVKDESGVEHGGYDWLAYDWRNLVPACDRCNSGTGKGSQFPIAGSRVFSPDDLADPSDISALDAIEQPLLLNPYFDKPEEHLQFGLFGVIAPVNSSPRGVATIDVCKLDDAFLDEQRAKIQEEVRLAVGYALSRAGDGRAAVAAELGRVREKYASAAAPFCTTARAAYREKLDEILGGVTDARDGS
ncbi:hypothetical protein ACI799_02445 [Blastococcus sp. SYSU DS0753]